MIKINADAEAKRKRRNYGMTEKEVMLSCIKKLGVLFVSLAVAGAPIAFAQGTAFERDMVQYVGPHEAGGIHCPGLTWHISRMVQPDKSVNLNGPIWYEDGSGTSIARGIGRPDGNFLLNVTPMNGNGPAGTITGQRMPDGSVKTTVLGQPCFAGTYKLAPGQTSAKQ